LRSKKVNRIFGKCGQVYKKSQYYGSKIASFRGPRSVFEEASQQGLVREEMRKKSFEYTFWLLLLFASISFIVWKNGNSSFPYYLGIVLMFKDVVLQFCKRVSLNQWFSTFDSWRPIKHNNTQFGDPFITFIVLKHTFWRPQSKCLRPQSGSGPTCWETLL